MVKGLDIFYEYFSEYSDQYVLIGGSACDLSFSDHDEKFQSHKRSGHGPYCRSTNKRICTTILGVY